MFSNYGTPCPGIGTNAIEVFNSAPVSCYVNQIQESDSPSIRHSCTGWAGTGSVPTSGTGTNVLFEITEDSTLTWLWEKQNLISVAVSGGSCAFGSQWVADGETTTATIVPATHLYSISLSGDTDGVTLSGTSLTIPSDKPRDIVVMVEEVKVSLDVATEHGIATSTGLTEWSWGDMVEASVESSVESNGWRYVCLGWRGTGSVPMSGTGTNLTFEIEEDSTLTWLWETNVWVECEVSGDAIAQTWHGWRSKDGALQLPFSIGEDNFSWSISGDADGVAVDAGSRTITVSCDHPRMVDVRFLSAKTAVACGGKPLEWSASAYGWHPTLDDTASDGYCLRSGEIAAGNISSTETTLTGPGTLSFDWRISAGRGDFARIYLDGTAQQSITRTASWTTVVVGIPSGTHTVRWAYERGSGSASGEDAAFLDNVDWRPQVSLVVSSAFGTATPAQGAHSFAYGDEVSASVTIPNVTDGVRRVCTGWRGTGSVPANGGGTSTAFVITNDSSIVWNWRTDYWIALDASGPVVTDFTENWMAIGGTVRAHYTPSVPYYTLSLSGDTEGVILDETNLTLTIPADRPRDIALSVTELTLAGSLDTTNLAWTTDGAAWFPQVSVSCDGVDAAQSGQVIGDDVSGLETTLTGPGTLSWAWRLDSAGNAGVDVILDGEWLPTYEPTGEWSVETLELGEGVHTIRFEFWNAGTAATITDCAYLDQVVWMPAASADPIPALASGATPSTVTNAIGSAGFADEAGVMAAIGGTATNYLAFKTWAQGVAGGEAAVVASDHAAVSWLLGAEELFENEPEIRIAALALAQAQGTGNREQGTMVAMTVTIMVKDGEEIALVDEEKVASMFEATGDLGDWDGAAKLTPSVTSATRNQDGTMTFTVVPGDGTATSAFLRIKVR